VKKDEEKLFKTTAWKNRISLWHLRPRWARPWRWDPRAAKSWVHAANSPHGVEAPLGHSGQSPETNIRSDQIWLQKLSFDNLYNNSIIIPDILSLKTTRAFWRQNTFTFNKPAPTWCQNTWSISLEVLHPFLFLIRFSGSDQPILLCI
jgi:hypothetical protein